jgi:hypothetical protein
LLICMPEVSILGIFGYAVQGTRLGKPRKARMSLDDRVQNVRRGKCKIAKAHSSSSSSMGWAG